MSLCTSQEGKGIPVFRLMAEPSVCRRLIVAWTAEKLGSTPGYVRLPVHEEPLF